MPGRKRARILIIDDESPIRDVLRSLLCESYECLDVSSAEDALAVLRAEQFDLVLSDIMMSGISGLEMVPQVLRIAPDTVVIMISGEQNIESAVAALRVGAFDYITKPFDLRLVEAAVGRALEHGALLVERKQAEEALRRAHDELERRVEERTAELLRANASLREQIAERERAEERIAYLAYHDSLTDLPNRALFEDRLAQSLTLAHRNERKMAIIFISLDRFKKFNDTLGHALGDRLLRGVADRLTSCVREGDTVARFEGDEFSLLLTQTGGAGEVAEMAQTIRQLLELPFNVDDHELYVTASMGIGLYPDDGQAAEMLLQNAGAALYRAKQQGGNNYQFYTADMNARAFKRLSMENSLRRALERDEFVVYYQPQVDTNTEKIIGVEALVRWQHPELGLISPAEFIPLAEDTGLIVPIGEWVLRTACAQGKLWQEAGFSPLVLSVNFSPRQFQQPALVEQIRRALAETRFDPRSLEMELTESSIMKDANLTIKTLLQLKEMGIQVSIDDFGTGYSSLSYLKRFPIDVLKIDRSFVCDSTTDPNDAAIVMAVITLAHSLKLKVKAEGVETEEQLRFLRLLRCDAMQGYLFSTPLPAEAFRQMLLEGEGVRLRK